MFLAFTNVNTVFPATFVLVAELVSPPWNQCIKLFVPLPPTPVAAVSGSNMMTANVVPFKFLSRAIVGALVVSVQVSVSHLIG